MPVELLGMEVRWRGYGGSDSGGGVGEGLALMPSAVRACVAGEPAHDAITPAYCRATSRPCTAAYD
jgi:hypothetical protein